MNQDASRSENAYQQLKLALQDGTLRPGHRVREVDIAEQFGISRTPAREAIRRLEIDGLVSFVPRHGAVISSLDHQQTMELYDAREVLEGASARFAAQHASAAEIEELEELITSETAILDDPLKLADLNRVFHEVLYRAAHNRFLERSLLALRDSMLLLGGTSLKVEGRQDSAHEEHLEIVEAIKARHADAAAKAASIHIRNAQRARLKLMRRDWVEARSARVGEP